LFASFKFAVAVASLILLKVLVPVVVHTPVHPAFGVFPLKVFVWVQLLILVAVLAVLAMAVWLLFRICTLELLLQPPWLMVHTNVFSLFSKPLTVLLLLPIVLIVAVLVVVHTPVHVPVGFGKLPCKVYVLPQTVKFEPALTLILLL
jgi:hypothetical protein